jgi:hypothetical protein
VPQCRGMERMFRCHQSPHCPGCRLVGVDQPPTGFFACPLGPPAASLRIWWDAPTPGAALPAAGGAGREAVSASGGRFVVAAPENDPTQGLGNALVRWRRERAAERLPERLQAIAFTLVWAAKAEGG